MILPVAASTAVREGEFRYFGEEQYPGITTAKTWLTVVDSGYSAVANALDYSAGAFPDALGDGLVDLDQGTEAG